MPANRLVLIGDAGVVLIRLGSSALTVLQGGQGASRGSRPPALDPMQTDRRSRQCGGHQCKSAGRCAVLFAASFLRVQGRIGVDRGSFSMLLDALACQQFLGHDAIRAYRSGIHSDDGHGYFSTGKTRFAPCVDSPPLSRVDVRKSSALQQAGSTALMDREPEAQVSNRLARLLKLDPIHRYAWPSLSWGSSSTWESALQKTLQDSRTSTNDRVARVDQAGGFESADLASRLRP